MLKERKEALKKKTRRGGAEPKTFWAEKRFGLKNRATRLEKQESGAEQKQERGAETKDKKKVALNRNKKGALNKKEKGCTKKKEEALHRKERRGTLKQKKISKTEKKKEGWNREGALNREGWTDNFSAFIFLRIFSEKLWWIHLCWIWFLAWTKFSLF